MFRRLLLQQAEAVAEGKDPVGVSFGEDVPPEKTHAGNFLVDA